MSEVLLVDFDGRPLEATAPADQSESAGELVQPYLDLTGNNIINETVVTDTLGVRDHIHHRQTALIVDGSPASYVEALEWIFDPSNREEVEQLRNSARRVVQEEFSLEKHVSRLLKIMEEAVRDIR